MNILITEEYTPLPACSKLIWREHYHYLLLIGQMNDMSAVTGPAPILEEEEEEEDGDVSAEGVEDKDIELVMSQVTRIRSIGSKVRILKTVNFFPALRQTSPEERL